MCEEYHQLEAELNESDIIQDTWFTNGKLFAVGVNGAKRQVKYGEDWKKNFVSGFTTAEVGADGSSTPAINRGGKNQRGRGGYRGR